MVDTNASQSKPDFPIEIEAPEGMPDIQVIISDDIGFGASSTLGEPIQALAIDSLAANEILPIEFVYK